MKLIVGLGNPGKQYEHTRHNVGFDVMAFVADALGAGSFRTKCDALWCETARGGEKVALALPQTYMNESGRAVSQLKSWYKLENSDLLVIYDDIDLEQGTVRVRPSGSAGTHNGMRSIVEQLGATDFPRVRVGVGHCPPAWELANWVLSRYQTAEERQTAFDAYRQAAQAALCWLDQGIAAAMNQYNTPRKKTKPEEEA